MEFGLALSGGAIRGAAHIGVLKALEEENLYPSWISGSSAGSIVAGLYSIGYSPTEIEDIALSLGSEVYDLNITGLLNGVLKLAIGKPCTFSGIIKGNKLEKLIKRLTKAQSIKDCNIPTAITGVDINNGRTIYYMSNKISFVDNKQYMYIDDVALYKAIRASISIPVIFKPTVIDGLTLVDGGVTDNLPGTILKQMGAKRVLGVYLGYCGQLVKGIDNIVEIANQSLDIMQYNMIRSNNNNLDYIINPKLYDVSLTDFNRMPECIEKGYKITKENIRDIKKAII